MLLKAEIVYGIWTTVVQNLIFFQANGGRYPRKEAAIDSIVLMRMRRLASTALDCFVDGDTAAASTRHIAWTSKSAVARTAVNGGRASIR